MRDHSGPDQEHTREMERNEQIRWGWQLSGKNSTGLENWLDIHLRGEVSVIICGMNEGTVFIQVIFLFLTGSFLSKLDKRVK
jgi:hypothetical protein